MNITLEQMNSINKVQLEIFRSFTHACDEMQLKYYMIHGSLLGALKFKGFFPYDDDIDVAMPREDYDKFIKSGSIHLPSHLFIQSCETEKEFPLPFAKLRDSRTSFIQPLFKKLKLNQGIYIDIFPIDNFAVKSIQREWLKLIETIYSIRISEKFIYDSKQPIWKRILRRASKIILPSWENAVLKRAHLYDRVAMNGMVITIGGKTSERGIPFSWFGEGTNFEFENMIVSGPTDADKYLKKIYGDYNSYDPSAKYLNTDGTVRISAEYVSISEPYLKINEANSL